MGSSGDARVRVLERAAAEYPPLLREVPGAPRRLFAAGRRLEPAPMVALVGSRRASRYGREVAAWLASGLAASGFVVVSGLALGIDAAAHRGALDAGGTTVAVLGCGLDVCYPAANASLRAAIAEQGTLLTEHPPGTPPFARHFPIRNRIIAGMSLGTVIVEARQRGGAMITARLASDMGREVFAVPGPVHAEGSRGAHALIREGARLVSSAHDVLEDLGFAPPVESVPGGAAASPPAPPELGPDEHRLLGLLDATPLLLDTLASQAGLPVSAAAAVLSRLELRGLLTRHPGSRFARAVR